MNEATEAVGLLSGDKLYQERARRALPLLVRQAVARAPVHYSALAKELGMPNPRNLNYVLGYIGEALEGLSGGWGERIPAIQCLVISKKTGLPGEGVWWFLTGEEDFKKLPHAVQRELVWQELYRVFEYTKWSVVLETLGLSVDYGDLLDRAQGFRGGGEGEQHRRLKEYVAAHPAVLRLPADAGEGTVEYPLPSGDFLDVLFMVGDDWSAAEVKSTSSGASDIVRGMFQCVKYRAVMEAYQATQNLPLSARAVLVLEGALPTELILMGNILGVEVVEGVRVP